MNNGIKFSDKLTDIIELSHTCEDMDKFIKLANERLNADGKFSLNEFMILCFGIVYYNKIHNMMKKSQLWDFLHKEAITSDSRFLFYLTETYYVEYQLRIEDFEARSLALALHSYWKGQSCYNIMVRCGWYKMSPVAAAIALFMASDVVYQSGCLQYNDDETPLDICEMYDTISVFPEEGPVNPDSQLWHHCRGLK